MSSVTSDQLAGRSPVGDRRGELRQATIEAGAITLGGGLGEGGC